MENESDFILMLHPHLQKEYNEIPNISILRKYFNEAFVNVKEHKMIFLKML